MNPFGLKINKHNLVKDIQDSNQQNKLAQTNRRQPRTNNKKTILKTS